MYPALFRPRDSRKMKATRADTTPWPTIRQLIGAGNLTIRVSGHCMEPLLPDQTMVSFRKTKTYLPGDVVIVGRPAGPPVIHRLIGFYPSKGALRYFTQADNAPAPDGSVTRDALLGKVCGGDCSRLVHKVPIRHRIKAGLRFLKFVGTHLKQRPWSLQKTT